MERKKKTTAGAGVIRAAACLLVLVFPVLSGEEAKPEKKVIPGVKLEKGKKTHGTSSLPGCSRWRGNAEWKKRMRERFRARIEKYAEEHGISVEEAVKKLREERRARFEELVKKYAEKKGVNEEEARKAVVKMLRKRMRECFKNRKDKGRGHHGRGAGRGRGKGRGGREDAI